MQTLFLGLSLFLAAPAWSQAPSEMAAQKIRDNFWLLTGPGGNIVLAVGPDLAYLVDDQIQPMTPKLKAEIAKITDRPLHFVINTHWHADHAGGNKAFGEAGAVIVAHDNVRKRLSSDQFIEMFQRKVPASPPIALPVVTFTDSVSLHLGGDDIDIFHPGPAHTDGDGIVRFHKADIIHMGDTFISAGYPFVDRSSGGSIDGFITAADRALKLAGPNTKIVPGHGPMSDQAGLRQWRDMLVTIRDRVAKAIKEKKTLAQVQEAKVTAEFDGKFKQSGFIKPEQLVQTIFEELSQKKTR